MSLDDNLLKAVLINDIEEVKRSLLGGANVNILSDNGISLLGRAIKMRNEEIILMLIYAEHYLSSDDEDDVPSCSGNFHWDSLPGMNEANPKESLPSVAKNFAACSGLKKFTLNGNESSMGLLLFDALRQIVLPTRGCHVNLVDFHDRTPLHYAAECGNLYAIEKLYGAGAIMNVSDKENVTPLHLAVTYGHLACVEKLLVSGSRINCKTSDKSSALHIACSRGYLPIVQLLVERGASLEIFDSSERTPLFIAVLEKHMNIVNFLLCAGAKVNVREIHGYTPLYEAVSKNNTELVEVLLKSGAKVFTDQNLLHCAIKNDAIYILELLLKYRAPIFSYDDDDDDGEAPVHTAIRYGCVDMLRLLLEYGALPSTRTEKRGVYPLNLAVSMISEDESDTFIEVLQLLLDYGADLNCIYCCDSIISALHEAIMMNKFIFCKELIRQGADPNLGEIHLCNIDNLGLVVRSRKVKLTKMLMYSGYQVSRMTPSLKYVTKYREIVPEMYDLLINFHNQPMSLAQLSRLAIRRSLGQNIVYKVSKLSLPFTLCDYLLLRDICP